jgi:hypothetical protein
MEHACLTHLNVSVSVAIFQHFATYNMISETLRASGCSEIDINDIDQPIPDRDNDDIIDGPTVLAHVELARTIREFIQVDLKTLS